MNPETTIQKAECFDCPSVEILRQYLEGSTNESTGSQIDAHLEVCSLCNQALEQLEARHSPRLQLTADPSLSAGINGSDLNSREEELLALAIVTAHRQNPIAIRSNIGPYRLVRRIGRGGMGEVYQAEHIKLKRLFALKLLPLQSSSPNAIDRFEREIAAAGKLIHPSIVHSTDAGHHGQHLYLAMELIDGWDLAKIARRMSPLPVAIVCEIGHQVALALAHAHSHGMVHRDIKPSNIMLDRKGQIKLLDFGLVMFEHWNGPVGELTTVGQFLGTLDYMAPEQAERSGNVDYRCDLYSLGATMYKLLTGHLPLAMYPNQSPIEKLRALSEHRPISIHTFRAEIPEPLCALIDQLLNTDPKLRPTSAAHVAQALVPFCHKAELQAWAEQQCSTVLKDDDEVASAELPLPIQKSMQDVQSSQPSRQRWRIGWIAWIAAALVPFGAWLGISMVLHDKDGNLVIESESADGRVRLLQGEQVVREMSLQQGNAITKLRAGQYEITIDASSDTFTIDQSTIVLKQGETLIARVTKSPSKAQPLSVSAPQSSYYELGKRLRALGLDESTLTATYSGKQLLEHFHTMENERGLDDWILGVQVLKKALSPEERKLAKPLLEAAIKKRGKIGIDVWISLQDWIDLDEIDREIEKRLVDLTGPSFAEHLEKMVRELDRKHILHTKDFTRTLELIERRILTSDVGELAEQINSVMRVGSSGIASSNSISDELFASYPMTAFATCAYYDTSPMGGLGQVVKDPEKRAIRLESKLKLSRKLFERKDYDKWLWLVAGTVSIYEVTDSPEMQFWNQVASQVERFLDEWQSSSVVIPIVWVEPNLTRAAHSQGWGIRTLGSSFAGGGMGGGASGFGRGLPSTDERSKVSFAIEAICVCGRLPESIRPTAKLEAIRSMLAGIAEPLESQKELLSKMSWASLRWDEEGRIGLYDPTSQRLSLDLPKREALEALAIRRWIAGLCESDLLSPSNVAFQFFAAMQRKNEPSLVQKAARELICHRGRERWRLEDTSMRIPKIGENWFNEERVEFGWDTCAVTGQFKSGNGMVASNREEFELRLELEPAGWRISRMIHRKEGAADELVFEF